MLNNIILGNPYFNGFPFFLSRKSIVNVKYCIECIGETLEILLNQGLWQIDDGKKKSKY